MCRAAPGSSVPADDAAARAAAASIQSERAKPTLPLLAPGSAQLLLLAAADDAEAEAKKQSI